MVLDHEPKPVGQDIDISIPSPDTGRRAGSAAVPPPAPTPVPDVAPPPTPPASSEPAVPPPAPQADTEKTPVEKPAPAPAQPRHEPRADRSGEAAKPATHPAPQKKAAKAATKGYAVQVAALAEANKARALQKKVSSAGFKTYTEIVKTSGGDVTRVRVGPFPDRKAAEAALVKLKLRGLNGTVVSK
jgi:DedD protein